MSISRIQRPGLLFGFIAALVVTAFTAAPVANADAISSNTQRASAYAIDPPLGIAGAAPLVMLNLSRDHQLFYKAFNDFTDVTGDNVIDTTYVPLHVYAGYFDSKKCYTYDTSNGYFSPTALAAVPTMYCSQAWSGNFLNWATMTRMDEVRQILYGGLRSTDTATTTVLERAFLPTDAHSFAKFYNGPDINQLIPYSASGTPPSSIDKSSTYYYDTQTLNENSSSYTLLRMQKIPSALNTQVGDQIRIQASNSTTFDPNGPTLEAPVRYLNTGGFGSDAINNRVELRVQSGMFLNMACTSIANCISALQGYTNWQVTNLTRSGVTICNTTVRGGGDQLSTTNNAPPLIRGVLGNYALWGSNESLQCQWYEEKNNSQSGFSDGFLSNGNRSAFSGLGSAAENPSSGNGIQLNARVQVCVTGWIGGENNCKQYPDATVSTNPYKPIGLLQTYGESGQIKFGLVTPTFDHNASGGVLRAALPDPGTNDGDFISNEVNAADGTFTKNPGIISNINALRIYGYKYESGNNYGDGNGCSYQQTGITTGAASGTLVSEGNCSSWGNPMAESYIETLRYLAGKTPNSAFASGSEDKALGMSVVATWNDPINQANFCAALNVINFNASSLSYDTDAVAGFDDLGTGKSVTDWTDLVGVGEGINGKSWFVGNSSSTYSGTDKDLCSAKAVASLSAVQGICPELPALKGGYLMAGAAYGAHINRIRNLGNDSSGSAIVPANDRTSLKVNTFGVQLATNTPQIVVPVPGSNNTKFVTIIPAYRLVLGSGVGGGALVDFKVLSQTQDGTTSKGQFYADWEDSFAGGDYDQDMWGVISYEITATTVKITTKPVSASTNNGQGFGYIINGTTQDGPHFHSGIYGFNYTDPTSPNVYNAAGTKVNGTGSINASGGCTNCLVSDPATTAVYTVGSTAASALFDPMQYAAKWGGFRADVTKPDGTDTPANDANPSDVSKWNSDPKNKSTPDNYFLVTDPGTLQTALNSLFRKILAKISSGTAASTVGASANGVGVTYQALYEAERTDSNGDRATWLGSMSALWTDSYGYLREDGNHNGQLDDYVTDPVVVFSYDTGLQRTIATRYVSTDPKTYSPPPIGTQVELTDLNYIWNSRNLLWDPGLVTDTQRAQYGSPANDANGRYIFTWVDKNGDGIPSADEVVPFAYDTTGATGINSSNYQYLNTNSTTEAQNIVRWIRGTEIAGLRSRTVDYGTGALQGRVTRLGDIVNSTPLAISAPAESYDLLYNDTSYASFRAAYRDRRQVVYVGANDGMLHAFNAGFYNASCQRFTTQPSGAVCTPSTPGALDVPTTVTATAHPLGAEIWAYVPKNLLPHLRWLTDPNYQHTYYVDGAPVSFDAKLFKADTTHVGGWGTILVVPFRLGGGSITVGAPVTTGSGTTATTSSKNVTSDSAYVVMDVTNPEIAPTVLGEITLPGTWTTSVPAVAIMRDAVSGTPNKFYLAVGSGPTDARKVASNQNLRVSVYDMASFINPGTKPAALKVFDMTAATGASPATDAQNSFAGDLIASDFNLDGKAEAVYFGSVLGDGSSTTFGGHFWRLLTNGDANAANWKATEMLSLKDASVGATSGMPVTVRPTLARNDRGAPVVYFGTGRLFNSADKATSGTQRIFSLIDTKLLPTSDSQYLAGNITLSNLLNITSLNVNPSTQAVTGAPTSGSSPLKGITDFSALAALFNSPNVAGWYRNLTTNGTNPSERVVSAQSLLGDLLLTAAYTPGTSICTGLGSSVLYGQNYQTGTGDSTGYFGVDPSGNAVVSTPLGAGLPAPPSLHTGNGSSTNGGKTVTACTQTSTGAIVCKDVATLSPVTSGESSWREPLGK